MDELIRHDNPEFTGLVDLGSCSIHTIHNAFGKGLEKCGKEIEQLCMDLHALFKYSAARREDFREVQIEMDLDLTNFLQHTVVRWLSIVNKNNMKLYYYLRRSSKTWYLR